MPYAVSYQLSRAPSFAIGNPLLSGSGVAAPTAPVLIITSPTTDNTPEFTIDFDNTVAAGDNLRLQVQVSGGDWSAPVSDTNHTITAPEDVANEVLLALSALGNATYQARANVTHGATSAWSNVVTFTIAAVTTNRRISSAGNARISSTGNNRIFA